MSLFKIKSLLIIALIPTMLLSCKKNSSESNVDGFNNVDKTEFLQCVSIAENNRENMEYTHFLFDYNVPKEGEDDYHFTEELDLPFNPATSKHYIELQEIFIIYYFFFDVTTFKSHDGGIFSDECECSYYVDIDHRMKIEMIELPLENNKWEFNVEWNKYGFLTSFYWRIITPDSDNELFIQNTFLE